MCFALFGRLDSLVSWPVGSSGIKRIIKSGSDDRHNPRTWQGIGTLLPFHGLTVIAG